MSASVTKSLVFSQITAVFGLVYEHFSHGVFSWHMAFAFLIPLLGGVIPLLPVLRRANATLWRCGILTLTVGSLVQGVLEIYGTTNRLCGLYGIAGGILLALSLGALLPGKKKEN